MPTIIQLNNFIQKKLSELDIMEIEAVGLAKILNEEGLLNDNLKRPGMPLRKYLRENKIIGGFQYPNKRWVIRRKECEVLFSIREAAAELDLTEQALYKKIERDRIRVEKIDGTIAIPASELGIGDSGLSPNPQGNIEDELTNIRNELLAIVQRLNVLTKKLNHITIKNTEGTMITLHEEIAAILSEQGKSLTTKQIAQLVNSRGKYKKKDGSPITDFQIHGRTKNYSNLFSREGALVHLITKVDAI